MIKIKATTNGLVLSGEIQTNQNVVDFAKSNPAAFKELQRDFHLECIVDNTFKFERRVENEMHADQIMDAAKAFGIDVEALMNNLCELTTKSEKEEDEKEKTKSRRIVGFAVIPIYNDELENQEPSTSTAS